MTVLRVIALLSALALSGCATSRPHVGAMACSTGDPSSQRAQFDVFFVTTRGFVEGAAPVPFDYSRSDETTYGRARLDVPRVGVRPFGSITPSFRIVSLERFPSARQFMSAVSAEGRRRREPRVLIYTHGYHEDFRKSMFRFGQFYLDGCLKTVPILFSWPSSGKILGHSYDEDSAAFSRKAYADLVELVLRSETFRTVNLMAHSMGNGVLLEGLDRMALEARAHKTGHSARLSTVILASPDVDVDLFRSLLPSAIEESDQLVLLASRKDGLLRISRILALGSPRAGDATAAELASHGVNERGGFRVVRMDGPEVGRCPAFGHRCATANEQVVSIVKGLLEGPSSEARY
jgi:esterase/lipase superfamily enzyme